MHVRSMCGSVLGYHLSGHCVLLIPPFLLLGVWVVVCAPLQGAASTTAALSLVAVFVPMLTFRLL